MKPDLLARAKSLYDSGLSLAEVGKRIGYTATGVQTAFRRSGISTRGNKTAQIIALYAQGLSTYQVASKLDLDPSSVRHSLMTHRKMRPSSCREVEIEVAVWASRFVRSCQRMPGDAPYDLRLNNERVDVKSAHTGKGDGRHSFAIRHKGSKKDPKIHIDSYFLVFLDHPGRPVYRLPVEAISVKNNLGLPADISKSKYPLQLLGHLDDPQKGV